MPEISPEALREVTQALERYRHVVSESQLRPNSQRTRYWQANAFVRWLKGEFTSGKKVVTNGYLTRNAIPDIDD
jgi:predicted deacetylase